MNESLSLSVFSATLTHRLKLLHFGGRKVCTTVVSTYQLKLVATIIGSLYTRVQPQSFDCRQVPQQDGRIQVPADHLSRPGVERHQLVPMLLVIRVTPRDVQLLTGVHEHTYTWIEEETLTLWSREKQAEQI